MNYNVIWQHTALMQLAQAWTDAVDRKAVNEDVDQIDLILSVDPDQKGNDYFGDRYMILSTLWVLYRVHTDRSDVDILQVGVPGKSLPHDEID